MSLFNTKKKKYGIAKDGTDLYERFKDKDYVQLNVIVDGEVLTEVDCPIIKLTNDKVTFRTPGFRFYFPEDVEVKVTIPQFYNTEMLNYYYDFEGMLTFEDAEGHLEVE